MDNRKQGDNMTKKTLVISLLLLTVLISISSANLKFPVKLSVAYGQMPSDYPMIFVDPPLSVTGVNETFTVSVKVYNLTEKSEIPDPHQIYKFIPLGNLYAFDIQFSWDPNMLEYVNHTLKIPVETYSDGVLHEPLFDSFTIDEVNENGVPKAEPGTLYWCSATSISPAPPFNCKATNATFFTMTFKVKKEGACKLEFKHVELLTSGTDNCNPGITIGDHDRGDHMCLHIKGGTFATSLDRDIGVESVSATSPAGEGCNVTVNATISNNGLYPENFTIGAYYNQTVVDEDSFATTGDWMAIKEFNVTNMEHGSKSWLIEWNTTGVLNELSEAHFYIMVNVTDIVHMENNAKLSNIVLVTTEVFSDIVVTALEVTAQYGNFPLIRNETASFKIAVWYNGTECDKEFNVKMYFEDPTNQIIYPPQWSWNINLAAGHSTTKDTTWDSTGELKGNYTFFANATIPNDEEENLNNNVQEQKVLVILPPILQINVSPYSEYTLSEVPGSMPTYSVLPEETISLNASGSSHPNEGASIDEYRWEIMDESLTLVDVITGEEIEYNFTSGYWTVTLTVKDNYNLTYSRFRPETNSYTMSIGITAEEPPAPGGGNIYLVVAIIVIIIIVVAVAVYIMRTRKK